MLVENLSSGARFPEFECGSATCKLFNFRQITSFLCASDSYIIWYFSINTPLVYLED